MRGNGDERELLGNETAPWCGSYAFDAKESAPTLGQDPKGIQEGIAIDSTNQAMRQRTIAVPIRPRTR